MKQYVVCFLRYDEESGAPAVEYGLMVGLIAVAIVVAVTAFGFSVRDLMVIPAGVFSGP